MSYCKLGLGWVGGWVGRWVDLGMYVPSSSCFPSCGTRSRSITVGEVGGRVGGWVGGWMKKSVDGLDICQLGVNG